MVSTFRPLKHSAKIHLRNFSTHAFGQNTPLPSKNSAWCKISLRHAKSTLPKETLQTLYTGIVCRLSKCDLMFSLLSPLIHLASVVSTGLVCSLF